MAPWLSLFFLVKMTFASGAQWPEGCIHKKIFPCAVYSYKKTYFKLDENQFFIAKDSLIEFQSSQEASFSKGTLWAQVKDGFHLKSPYGELTLKKESGQVVVDYFEQGVDVRVVDGYFDVKARADRESYVLSSGLSVQLGPVEYGRKMASVTFPKVYFLKDYIKSIEKVFPFLEFNFQEHVDKVAGSIRQGLSLQSRWNQTIVEQKLVDDHDKKVRQKYEAEFSSRRDRFLRRLFRQKNNFEDE